MNFRDFLQVASELASGPTEAHWRSAVSRAYYAAFHVACQLFVDLGFTVPRADRAHAYVWLRLTNSGHGDVQNAGLNLNHLRQQRNRADYDAHRPVSQPTAVKELQTAIEIVRVLDSAMSEPTRSQITDAMKTYERDVLKDVTWQP